jgi:hypothetical protein
MDTLTEKQILSAKRRANGYFKVKDKSLKYDDGEYLITPEQTEKGLKFLLNKVFKPSRLKEIRLNEAYREFNRLWTCDDIRKNCGLDTYEIDVLTNFDHFLFVGWTDENENEGKTSAILAGYHSYLPIYRVVDRRGDFFDYYYTGGNYSFGNGQIITC